jgi:hypothetical protein
MLIKHDHVDQGPPWNGDLPPIFYVFLVKMIPIKSMHIPKGLNE